MIRFPDGLQLEPIRRSHARAAFVCGQAAVEAWLSRSALQAHDKHLSVTKVVADSSGVIAGFYTLAAGQVDAGELPAELGKGPPRALPTAVIAWLGVATSHQRTGLGGRVLAAACTDLLAASSVLPFVVISVDCLDDRSRAFFGAFGFVPLASSANRLFLRRVDLEAATA